MKKIKYLLLSVMLLIVASSVYGQEPTQIPAGGTWTTARGIINTNMTQVYDSLQSLRYSTNLNYSFIESHADSITAHTAKIALRLLKSDTASMLANYTRNGELNSALAAKVNISDTAAMLAHYALLSEVGSGGGLTSEQVATQINDSLTALYNDAEVGIQLQDSTGNAVGNYVTRKALNDSIAANLGSAVGLTLNSGTLTLTGDLATADDITFFTNGDGQYDLPAGGGNLTIMSQVQGWISDSLDAFISGGSEGIALSDSIGISEGNYMTRLQTANLISDSLDLFTPGASMDYDTIAYLEERIDSLVTVVEAFRIEVNDLIAAVEAIGVDITPPRFSSAELGSFANDTLIVLMDNDDIQQDSIPLASAFNLTEGGNQFGIDHVLIGNDTLYMVLDSIGHPGMTYLLDYTQPTSTPTNHALQDSTGNKTASWTNRSVTNNFLPLVASIDVWGTAGATTITTSGGTLQMLKKTLPTNAGDTTAVWSVVNGTGDADISVGGLLTAVANGTVNARATANDGSAVYGQEEITISGQASAPPSFIASDGYTKGWYIADETDDITMTNNYVSLWEDHLGGGENLSQGDGGSQPLWSTSGITFDGVDDELMNSDFALNQPIFIYVVMNQLASSANSRILLFRTAPYGFVGQSNQSGILSITMNGYDNYIEPTTAIGEVGIYRIYLNGASSKFIYNNGTPVTGSVGTNAMVQLALGHGGLPSNVRFLEIIVRQVSESSNDETAIYNYLADKYL